MSSIRNRMHLVLWSLLFLFVLSMTIGGLVGGANIIDQIIGRVDPGKAIGVVNGAVISPDDFSRMVSDRLENLRNSGQEITDAQLDRIRQEVWDDVVHDLLVQQAVADLGLTATDEEVLFHLRNNPPSFLRSNPVFQTDGQFDLQKYQEALNNPQGNEWVPIEQFMKNTYIPSYKLQQLITSSVSVTDDEVWNEYVIQNVDYTINALHVTKRVLDVDALIPSDEELRQAYEERREEFARPERRALRFVSWRKVPTAADTLEIFHEAEELKQRALRGEDFAALANLYSEDPGNRVTPDSGRGGDLGWFGRNQMVKPFETAAFSAEPGEIVGPILTNFGYHIIKVYEKRGEGDNEQVHAAHILLKISMSPRTRDALQRQATLFSYDAEDYGFDAALDTHQVTARETKLFAEDASFLPGVGAMRAAVRFAFNNELGAISEPLENDDYFAVFMLDSIQPPGPAPFEEVQAILRRDLTKERTMATAKEIAEDLYLRWKSGATFDELLAENEDLEYARNDTKKLARGFNSVGRSYYVIGALLKAHPGDLLGPLRTARGYAVVEVVDIAAIDSTDFQIKQESIRNSLLNRRQKQVFNDWVDQLKAEAEIVDNRKYYF
jgi:parvulin-like peptidyl-prolyl isomerase